MTRRTAVALVLAVAAPCCAPDTPSQRSSLPATPFWDPPKRPTKLAEAAEAPPVARVPSGYFLVDRERLAALRADPRASAGPAWTLLLENAEEALRTPKAASPENVSTAYLVTEDARFAAGAYRTFELLAQKDVRWDSYLTFGDLMRGAAFVLVYCRNALTADRRSTIVSYLERWTHELWFDNQGSGWGLADPANNYHHAFLEGTAYAAYALAAENRPSAAPLLALLRDKIEGKSGVLEHLVHGGRGGDWHEGANYGQRSKQRMFSAFAAIATMGGPDYFARTSFPEEAVLYAAYQVQPGLRFLAPNGDLPRAVVMDVTPFDRDYVQLAAHFTHDARTRALAAWYLHEVAPSYVMTNVKAKGSLYRDVLLPPLEAGEFPSSLPLGYRARGTEWLNARSSWAEDATSLTVVATPQFTQSHAHIDTGSFVIWRGGWQALDAGTLGRSGLNWSAGAHNMIYVPGHARMTGQSRGLVRYGDDGRTFYAQIDGSNVFTRRQGESYPPLLDEWTRELVFFRPGSLVVYDRVAPKPEAAGYVWRAHFARKPTFTDGRYLAANGSGSVALTVAVGGASEIAEDVDLPDGPTHAWRLEVHPNARHRFLARFDVASSPVVPPSPPHRVEGDVVEGIAWNERVVVFSRAALGAPPPLPFTYRVNDEGHHEHTLADMEGAYDVDVRRGGGWTTVRVVRGTRHRADENGLLRFQD